MSLSHVTEGEVPSVLDTYEPWINEIVKKLGWEERLRSSPPDILWHYTSLDAARRTALHTTPSR